MLKLSLFLLLATFSSLSSACTGITSDKKFMIKILENYELESVHFKLIEISTLKVIKDFTTQDYQSESGGSYQPDVIHFYDADKNHYSFAYTAAYYLRKFDQVRFFDTNYDVACF